MVYMSVFCAFAVPPLAQVTGGMVIATLAQQSYCKLIAGLLIVAMNLPVNALII